MTKVCVPTWLGSFRIGKGKGATTHKVRVNDRGQVVVDDAPSTARALVLEGVVNGTFSLHREVDDAVALALSVDQANGFLRARCRRRETQEIYFR